MAGYLLPAGAPWLGSVAIAIVSGPVSLKLSNRALALERGRDPQLATRWPTRSAFSDSSWYSAMRSVGLLRLFFSFFILSVLGSLFSLFVRFRRSRGEKRQQIKWFAYAGTYDGWPSPSPSLGRLGRLLDGSPPYRTHCSSSAF